MENSLCKILYYFKNIKITNNRKYFLLSVVLFLISFNNTYSQTYSFFHFGNKWNFEFVKNNNNFNVTKNNQNLTIGIPHYYPKHHNSSISDTNHNLLLYINNNYIYDFRHNIIENGDLIFGTFEYARGKFGPLGISFYRNLFVKRPGNNNQFILFHLKDYQLYYTLIQHNVNLNTFKIIEKNIKYDEEYTYAFDLTHQGNSQNIWLVRKIYGPNFISNLITSDNLNSKRQFSYVNNDEGLIDLEKFYTFDGNCLKISPDGKNLAFNGSTNILKKNPLDNWRHSFNDYIYLFKYNNNNGEVSNKLILDKKYDGIYDSIYTDIEFSAKSKKLYCISPNSIIVFDISVFNFNKIIPKKYQLYLPNTKWLYSSFLGPDKNIYITGDQTSFLTNDTMNGRNTALNVYKFDENNLKYDNKSLITLFDFITPESTNHNIAYFPFEVMTSQLYEVETELTQNLCVGEDFMLDCNVLKPLEDTLYKWTGPKNFTSNLKNPIIQNIDKSHEGIYTVEITNSKKDKYYTGFITLQIHEAPKFSIKANKIKFCEYDSVRLSVVEEIPTTYKLLWSNGDTTLTTFGKENGVYSLTITNEFGCSSTELITIEKVFPPQFNLTKDGEECGTADITLKSDVEFPSKYKYLWNTGAITPELQVSKNGIYTLIITDTNGCQTSKSIEIIFGKKPIAEIRAMGATTFCEGGKVELRATGGMSSNDLNYEWNTGEQVPNIWVDKSGIYRVVITHKFSNCVDSAEIEIKVNPNLVSSIEQIGALCKGGEVTLNATPQGTEYKYLWSTGATTPNIKVSQAGKYTVEVSLDGTCKSSAEIEVIANQAEDFEILGEGKFCVGEVVKLSSDKDFAEYLWSNGETTKEINVTLSGTYNLKVTDENGCTNEKSINVEFVSPREYKLEFTDYDFGNVEIGTEKRVKVNIPGELGFKLRGDFPLDINTMEMVFKPDTERDYIGEIVLNYGGICDTSVTIIFKGRGVNSVKYFAKVIAPKVTTEAGLDNVELPIKFEINDENVVYPFGLDYKIKLSLNFDVYIPQIPSTINGSKREFELVGKANITKGENILSTIIGKTYLSQNMENAIEIVSFEHKTDRLTVEEEDGYLNITGICVPELRGLIFFTPTKMSVSPNPVSSDLTIKINTEEKGNHKVRLVDITGNSREIADFEVKELTEKVIKLNAKELSKGQYFLELITPNQTLVEKVVVE